MLSRIELEKTGVNSGRMHLSREMKSHIQDRTRYLWFPDHAILLSDSAVEIYRGMIDGELIYHQGMYLVPVGTDCPDLLLVNLLNYDEVLNKLQIREGERFVDSALFLYAAHATTMRIFKNNPDLFPGVFGPPSAFNMPYSGSSLRLTSILNDKFYETKDYFAVGELDRQGIELWTQEKYAKRIRNPSPELEKLVSSPQTTA
jgi:hypothetical protein